MIDNNNPDAEIKKIIDPKNGFTLYLRKFDDASISQVSTLDSFPTPHPMGPYTDELAQNVSDIKSELNTIKNQSNKVINSNTTVINTLSKKNSTLTFCVYLLGMAIMASIFF